MSIDSDDTNFQAFRDCLFNVIVQGTSPDTSKKQKKIKSIPPPTSQPSDIDALIDFSDYLTSEIFPSLPADLRTISHAAMTESISLSDKYSLPLSLNVYEELTAVIPPAVTDSLEAYGLISPPSSDVQSFISPIITSYLGIATTQPPRWSETRAEACEICERAWVPLTYHHLIPKAVHAKALKRGWHEEAQLNSVAWLCRACHSFVHRMASNEELAKEYFTVELICEREDVEKWAGWVRKVRWKKT